MQQNYTVQLFLILKIVKLFNCF